ncbi:TPA: M61 family peptidase, partial [Candidatus Bipolaricaulota bacterium]|nr:M61 family peptidase [Candidatus Bipolaricaulota bacterium]
RVSDFHRSRLVFSMPIWIPGSYFVGTYGDKVMNFAAVGADGAALPVEKLSKSDWEVQTRGVSDVRVSYDVLTSRHGFMGRALDSTGALVQGVTTWMYVRGLEKLPARVHINPPDGWDVAVALPATDNANDFLAKNYDELADSPILMGTLQDTVFYCYDKPHEIWFRGEADFSHKDFTRMVEKIVKHQIDMFGVAPYDRYVFQFTLMPSFRGGGGLEHANSTSIGLSAVKIMQDIKNAATVTAHEFFHVWNVKRITSDQLLPLRYDREARMESLWWLEGVTSYYAALTLIRTGIWSSDEFLKSIAREIEILQENPDRLQTTLAQASWNIWEKGYGGTGISYYNKGELVGMLLDLTLRKVTDNQKSLDDVFGYLWQNYALQHRGFADDDLQKVVEKISGKDFGPFFDRYVTGLVELPYREIMALAGVDVTLEKKPTPTIGRIRFLGERNRIFSLDDNGPAARAGLRRGDLLVSADGQKITSRKVFADIILNKSIGDTLVIVATRNGSDIRFDV